MQMYEKYIGIIIITTASTTLVQRIFCAELGAKRFDPRPKFYSRWCYEALMLTVILVSCVD